MAIYDGDQPTGTAILVNGTHAILSKVQAAAALPASTAFVFSIPYAHVFKGVHYVFRKGVSYSLKPDLKAALLAASAPMTGTN